MKSLTVWFQALPPIAAIIEHTGHARFRVLTVFAVTAIFAIALLALVREAPIGAPTFDAWQ